MGFFLPDDRLRSARGIPRQLTAVKNGIAALTQMSIAHGKA
jgi:hypothetical protein